jgi:hypothetical protein
MKVSHAATDKYDALTMSVRMSDYGYWVVTYSVSPGVYMSVMVCKTGISADQARDLGSITLSSQTGQRVTR